MTLGAFHITFESFTEKRFKSAATEPYWSGPIDGPECGPEPREWDVHIPIPAMFVNRSAVVEVPHTSVVRTCYTCDGSGQVTCHNCGGSRRVRCSSCGGDGRVRRTRTVTETDSQGRTTTRTETYTESCGRCGGDGRVTCSTCGGTGVVTCSTCNGARRLRQFKNLNIVWTNHVSEEVIEKSDLPDELVSGAQGTVLLKEEEDRVSEMPEGAGGPFRGTTRVNTEVHRAANRLLRSHRFPQSETLHRQRLVVRGVPVHEAHYAWGKETRRFWVFGLEEQVYAPSYPLSILRIAGVTAAGLAAVGLVVAMIITVGSQPDSASKPIPTYRPSLATLAEPPSPPPRAEPLPPPPPPPLLSASAAPPKPAPGKAVVELRTEPAGVEVLLGKRKLGRTPLHVSIAARPAGSCKGGTCSGGRCSGSQCWGGICADTCIGARCRSGTCDGATCEGASCPKGYRCIGVRCTGRTCSGGTCDRLGCENQQCYGEAPGRVCMGGTCRHSPCLGESCVGGICTGGNCEPVTELTFTREGHEDRKLEIGPSDASVHELRLDREPP